MEEQDGGFPGVGGGRSTSGSPGETHRPDQAGLHYPAIAGTGCGGPGQPQGLQGPAGSADRRAGRTVPDRGRARGKR